MAKKVDFIFIVPIGVGHWKYKAQWLDSLEMQKYDNSFSYTLLDNDRKGQTYWINLILNCLNLRLPYYYINFQGIDDYLSPYVLHDLNEIIVANNYPPWLYTSHDQLFLDGNIKHCKAKPWNYSLLKKQNYIAGGAVYVRADLYAARRFRDLAFGMGGDWDMWLRLGKQYEPLVIPEIYSYTERIGTSLIRLTPGKLKTKIFNLISYPVWRIVRRLRKVE